jgi:predicted 2-oxoglutarate/Fe(II)-dependent dioxygenase YbiX
MTIYVNGIFPGELKLDVTIGGCIDIFENVWPDPKKTIDLVENELAKTDVDICWERAPTIGDGVFQNFRTNKTINVTHQAKVTNNPLMQNIHNQFNICLLSTSIPYSTKHGIAEGLWHEDYSLLKYSDNQEYKSHYDGTTSNGRVISALIYLNDDYKGGELEFVNFKVKIKPQAGMLILFPSNYAYRHIAHPVTDGTKYAIVTWIRDRIV